MVTAGANQAFVNVVLTLLDPGDGVVLFVPYYFNHLMAIQMTGGARKVVYGRCDAGNLHPDLDWLEQHLQNPGPSPFLSNRPPLLSASPPLPPPTARRLLHAQVQPPGTQACSTGCTCTGLASKS